jgi:macrodomain Ter protein organizer (MatP/YcbG family)
MGNKQIKSAVAARSPSGLASKVSVTIDSMVLRQARVAAKRSGKTLSAHISQALERDLRRQRMAELIAEFEVEHGAITPAEVAKAIASWQR